MPIDRRQKVFMSDKTSLREHSVFAIRSQKYQNGNASKLAPNSHSKKAKLTSKRVFFLLKNNLSQAQLQALGINEYLVETAPLHLQLCNINLDKKFKKQKITLTQSVPFQPYFIETLNRLNLKLPESKEITNTNV